MNNTARMNQTTIDTAGALIIKIAIGAAIWASTNIYLGALTIAAISAFTRIMFEAECQDSGARNCLHRMFRYFVISAALAMVFVHIGLWLRWDTDMLIVVSSFFAFMSEETLMFLKSSWHGLLTRLIGLFLK